MTRLDYLREEHICSVNGGEAFMSLAFNRSSDLNRGAYHQDLVHGETGASQPFEEVADIQHRVRPGGLPEGVAAQLRANLPLLAEIAFDRLPPHTPSSAAGAAAARVGALGFAHEQLVRIIDLETLTVTAQARFNSPVLEIALDGTGTKLAVITGDGVWLFADHGRRNLRKLDGWLECRHLVWCAEQWVISNERGGRWQLELFSDEDGSSTGTVPLTTPPFQITAAASASVVACGGHHHIEVIDLEQWRDAPGSMPFIAHPHGAAAKDNAVEVALSPAGDCVISRGTLDQQLCALPRGQREATPLGQLKMSLTTNTRGDVYHTRPAFAVVRGGLVTVVDGEWTFRRQESLGPTADRWC